MNNTQTIERTIFECGLNLPTVVTLALMLLAALAWLLLRERRVLGSLCAAGFWLLRAIALAVLVWMFLQPTRVTETSTMLPQSVAVVIDRSDSMKVIDDETSRQAVRWQLAGAGEADESGDSNRDAQVAVDSAMVALEVANGNWNDFRGQLQQGGAQVKKNQDRIAFALERASTHLSEHFRAAWPDDSDNEVASQFAEEIAGLAEAVADIDVSDTDPNAIAQRQQQSQVLLDELAELVRRVRSWSRSIQNTILTERSVAAGADRQTQAIQLAERMQRDAGVDSNDALSVKRFTFDQQLTPVVSNGPWQVDEDASNLDPAFTADANVEEGSRPTAVASRTNLTAALEQVSKLAASQSIRSAIFLTDGAHNAVDTISPAELAAASNEVAISFVPIGSLSPQRDVQLYHVEHPRSVIAGDQILVEAWVSAVGFEGQSINLQLSANEELIEEKTLVIDSDQIDLRHSFTVPTEQPGSIEFELKVEPLEAEISDANNRSIFRVGIVRDKIRVMLADRISRWEYRYLDQLLYRDEHLEHEMILFDPRLRATGNLKINAALPDTVEGWSEYEVAVIGDLTPEQLSIQSQESLAEFVKEKGGVAILIAGRKGMPHAFADQPLEGLLPVEKLAGETLADEFQVGVNRLATTLESIRLDDARATSEALWQQVFREQPITWLSEYCQPRPSARRLLDAIPVDPADTDAKQPVWVCWHKVGAGRVLYLAAPDTYRLRYRRGDRLHHRFWAQVLRWITSEDPGSDNGQVQLTTDAFSYLEREPIGVTAFLTEPSGEPVMDAEVEVEFDSGAGAAQVFSLSAVEDQPGRYLASVKDLLAGAYRVRLLGTDVDELMEGDREVETFVNVITTPNLEQINTTCNRPLMRQIAQSTGGLVVPPTALAEWLTLQTKAPETISQSQRQPLWNRWWCLWVAFGCLFTEWAVRRAKGLT